MDGAADLVLINGWVKTLWQGMPRAQAVAAMDGSIVAVGSTSEIMMRAGPQTQIVDCRGRCVVPGFHDAHIHLLACAAQRLAVDCSPSRVHSIQQIQDLIFAQAQATPAGTWIRAGNYDEFQLDEHRHPTRWDLDVVAPLHPVKLQHRSLHACVLNSAALLSAGLDHRRDGTRATLPGVTRDIDTQTRQPTGLVYDHLGSLSQVLPPIPEVDLRSSLKRVFSDLLANGITSVQDATVRNGAAEWERLSELCTEEGVHPRVSMMIGPNHISDLAARGVRSGSGDTGLSLGPVKLVLTETDGAFRPSPDELRAQVWHAHRYGFQVAIHAVEESEICVAAEALAGPAHDDPARHHRIEHCSVLPPGLVEILSEAKVAICTQPGFVFESGDRYLADVEPHLLPFLYGIKSLLDNGIPVGAGSDAPVASFNPLHGIGTSVTRLSRGGQSVAEGEAISVEQALRLYTTGAASICREQDRKGSIAPGKLADMVILSDEITAVPAEAIRDIRVDATIVGGQIAWERDL